MSNFPFILPQRRSSGLTTILLIAGLLVGFYFLNKKYAWVDLGIGSGNNGKSAENDSSQYEEFFYNDGNGNYINSETGEIIAAG